MGVRGGTSMKLRSSTEATEMEVGARQLSQEERRACVLRIDLTRQSSDKLGLIFHRDQQHGVSFGHMCDMFIM